MKERRPITREAASRCRAAKDKAANSEILDGFINTTGYNRKCAVGILNGGGKAKLLRLDGKPVKARIPPTGPEENGSMRNAAARMRPPASYGCGSFNKARRWVRQAMDDVYASFPVPLKGIDRGNGGEFINTAMKTWCGQRGVSFTRARSYRKNDNCYVEQKNGDAVRKTVGYARYTSGEALAAVYQALNPLLNYSCTKLIDKTRDAQGKTKKVYDQPVTLHERLLVRDEVPREAKDR